MASKITIDLNVKAYDFDGKVIKLGDPPEESNLSDVLRKLFFGTSSPKDFETTMRYMGWCGTLARGTPLVLESVDYDVIQKIILDSHHTLQLKGPLLIAMKEAKDASEKELSTKAD